MYPKIPPLLTVPALILLVLLTIPASAMDKFSKPIRDVQVTLSYKVRVQGQKNTIFELTSLLPPDIAEKQKIGKISFHPQPNRIYQHNGNRYAYWKLKGKKITRTIEIAFPARIFQQILATRTQKKPLTATERSKFLSQEKYLDVNSRSIRKACSEIPKKKDDVAQIKAILNYVKDNMSPAKASTKMLGASDALKKGRGDCTEYTDLLVTLARQLKLPARHISGYILTNLTSIGHSWAEIYTQEKGWITVDPLHMDLQLGSFSELNNKYLAFSGVRNDRELNNGMLYAWKVTNGFGARVLVQTRATDR